MSQQTTGRRNLTAKDIYGWGAEPGDVDINNNENPMGPSPRAMEAVSDYIHGVNRYAWSASGDLVRKLVGIHRLPRRERMNDNLLFEGGSGQLLYYAGLFGIKDGKGESIEAPCPYGDMSRVFTRHRDPGYDTNAIRVPLTDDYVHDLDAMLAAITPITTVISITNPEYVLGKPI